MIGCTPNGPQSLFRLRPLFRTGLLQKLEQVIGGLRGGTSIEVAVFAGIGWSRRRLRGGIDGWRTLLRPAGPAFLGQDQPGGSIGSCRSPGKRRWRIHRQRLTPEVRRIKGSRDVRGDGKGEQRREGHDVLWRHGVSPVPVSASASPAGNRRRSPRACRSKKPAWSRRASAFVPETAHRRTPPPPCGRFRWT